MSQGLKESRAFICVKRMGELNEKPFHAAARKIYNSEEAAEKAMELCSLWEDHLRDPNWHPYKVIQKGQNVEVCTLSYIVICILFWFYIFNVNFI